MNSSSNSIGGGGLSASTTLIENEVDDGGDHGATLESQYMQLEASWLIKKEVPIICKRVRRILNRCLILLKPTTLEDKSNTTGLNDDNSNINGETTINNDSNLNESIHSRFKASSLDFKDMNFLQDNYQDLDDLLEDVQVGNSTIHFDTPEGSRGTLMIDGWLVESSDIQIRFNKQTKPGISIPCYKTLINKAHPWRIQQIQNSYNYLNLILTELEGLIIFTEGYIPMEGIKSFHHQDQHNNSSSSSSLGVSGSWLPSWTNRHYTASFPELLSLVESVKKISEWLSLAKDEILLPSRHVFPNTLFQPNVLQPPLPFEINVDITVSNCELVFSVHELNIASSNQVNQSSQLQIQPQPQSQSSTLNQSQNINSIGSSNNSNNINNNSNNNNNNNSNNNNSSSNLKQSIINPIKSIGSNGQSILSSSSTTSITSGSNSPIPRSSSPENSHLSEINQSIQPFQTTKGGSLQTISLIEKTEFRKPLPLLLSTFTLLTNAYDRLADLSEKLLAVSNIN